MFASVRHECVCVCARSPAGLSPVNAGWEWCGAHGKRISAFIWCVLPMNVSALSLCLMCALGPRLQFRSSSVVCVYVSRGFWVAKQASYVSMLSVGMLTMPGRRTQRPVFVCVCAVVWYKRSTYPHTREHRANRMYVRANGQHVGPRNGGQQNVCVCVPLLCVRAYKLSYSRIK